MPIAVSGKNERRLKMETRNVDRSVDVGLNGYQRSKRSEKKRVADTLIELAQEAGLELFVTAMGDTYGKIPRNSHVEVQRINSRGFRNWLSNLYYERYNKGFSNRDMEEVKYTLEARAMHDGSKEEAYIRVAAIGDKLYLDLANDKWQVVEVANGTWGVIDRSPVNFWRPKGMLSLPVPEHGGSIDELTEHMDFDSQEDYVLTVSWLIGAYHPTGPYPILVYVGQAGSGKTTRARMLSMLIDPHEPTLRVGTPDIQGIDVAAKNTRLLVFDNLSSVPVWFSDRLCTLSTGGGSSKRTLYENDEETLFDARRPVILTGINELATRGDLLNRSVLVHPKLIEEYRTEEEILADFKRAQPRLLGAVLDGVAAALMLRGTVKIEGMPRMADFATWATASELGLGWDEGTFMEAYRGNNKNAALLALEASSLGMAIKNYMDTLPHDCEEHTAEMWLRILEVQFDNRSDKSYQHDHSWPKQGSKFGNDINQLAPSLKVAGITVTKEKRITAGVPTRICRDAA